MAGTLKQGPTDSMTKKELQFNYSCLKIAAAIIIAALIIAG